MNTWINEKFIRQQDHGKLMWLYYSMATPADADHDANKLLRKK